MISITALVVAVFGATPLGHAAGEKLAAAVPPFAKTAGYAKFAGNSTKLNGRKSTLKGAPGTIPVVGPDGKLPAAIGAVGPQGPQGPKGDTGAKGSPGATGDPGTSGYEIVTATTAANTDAAKSISVPCPTGKKAVGGGAAYNLYGYEAVSSHPLADGSGWYAYADHIPFGTTQAWALVVWAVCMNVASP
jgi:hypothetical protein